MLSNQSFLQGKEMKWNSGKPFPHIIVDSSTAATPDKLALIISGGTTIGPKNRRHYHNVYHTVYMIQCSEQDCPITMLPAKLKMKDASPMSLFLQHPLCN